MFMYILMIKGFLVYVADLWTAGKLRYMFDMAPGY